MRGRIILIALIALPLLTACNLGIKTPEPTIEPLPTDDIIPAGPPVVNIISPRSGDEFLVNSEILVSVQATDSQGITRIQLFANQQSVKIVSSESSNGDRVMSAVLDYMPRAAGSVTLTVVAYRKTVQSESAQIQVQVRNQASQVTATADTGISVPNIPNDGLCRALINTGLNFRRGPGTDFDVITVLSSGTLSLIVGRTPDNTWWRLRLDTGLEGWVSSTYTTEYGNCLSIPVVASATPAVASSATPTITPIVQPTKTNTPVPGKPDLVVTSIVGESSLVIPSGSSTVSSAYSISITNTGLGPSGPFASTITIGNKELDLAVISNLDAGASIVLQANITFDAEGVFELRVDADPENQVVEISDVNNFGFKTPSITVTKE